MEPIGRMAATSLVAVPYIWSAERDSKGTYAFSGYVPAEPLKSFLAVRAGKVSSDTTEVAGGAPEGFISHALAALTALANLEEGRASFNGTEWALAGKAASKADRQAATAAVDGASSTSDWKIAIELDTTGGQDAATVEGTDTAAEPVTGNTDASRELISKGNELATTPPEIAVPEPEAEEPDTGIMVGTDKGSRDLLAAAAELASEAPEVSIAEAPEEPVIVTGEDEGSRQLLSAASKLASEAPAIAVPEPEEPVVVTGQDEGSRKLLSSAEDIAGSAPEIDISASEEPAAAPATSPEPVAEPSLYRFAASKPEGGPISLTGVVPADAARRYFGVVAGQAPTDHLFIYKPAPQGFIDQATVGVRALAEMQDGELVHEHGKWTLTGTALDEEARNDILANIAALDDADAWSTRIATVPAIDICRKHVETLAADNRILFNAGSARLTGDSREAIDRLAGYLEECPDTDVYVEGHTDSDGPADMNMALSVARAEAVTAALVERGVKPDRLYSVGYGETLPIATNATRQGKSRNRRIAFKIEERQN